MLFGHPLFFVAGNRMCCFYEPQEKKGRAIGCLQYDGHAFIYENARVLSQWRAGEAPIDRVMLQHEAKSQLEPWDRWQLYLKPEPGLFFCDDLAWIRARLLESGRSPR